ncbi:hypothetical protein AB1Y20_020967 [Prymnesium parvum]|uniref:Uncharacterized protein n=1 Tax=Prymnesium parvum TaxID=97485 RepID=A0AB34JIA3_PRYPA|mmetsp:Transcript_8819/g.13356  ORF Transcript_8819/g.13356 Transcript_8819/m.13356 type:complete len:172 (+) Transcript_8819:25-540(+)
MAFRLLLLSTGLLAAMACVPPDCDREDCGTCGVSCCSLTLSFPGTNVVDLMQMLNSSIAKGGPDTRFVLRPTAENPFGFGDLRPYHPDVVFFIGQAWHKTAKYTYTDTVNYLIYAPPKDAPNSSKMKVHSISQIGGAYCDAGQNYKNIVVLVKSLNIPFEELASNGCPTKA